MYVLPSTLHTVAIQVIYHFVFQCLNIQSVQLVVDDKKDPNCDSSHKTNNNTLHCGVVSFGVDVKCVSILNPSHAWHHGESCCSCCVALCLDVFVEKKTQLRNLIIYLSLDFIYNRYICLVPILGLLLSGHCPLDLFAFTLKSEVNSHRHRASHFQTTW